MNTALRSRTVQAQSLGHSYLARLASSQRLGAMGNPSIPAIVTSLVPTGVFLVADRWFGLIPAMIAASSASLAIILLRRRRRRGIGLLLPLSFGFIVVKALAGAITGSQVVYFGAGLALSSLIAIGIGASAFTSRPVAGYLLPLVTPYRHLSFDHPVYRRVSAQITAVVALAELAITGWEAWHLTLASASEFVVTRTLSAYPVMGVIIFFSIAYVRFRLDRYEHVLLHSSASRVAQYTPA